MFRYLDCLKVSQLIDEDLQQKAYKSVKKRNRVSGMSVGLALGRLIWRSEIRVPLEAVNIALVLAYCPDMTQILLKRT